MINTEILMKIGNNRTRIYLLLIKTGGLSISEINRRLDLDYKNTHLFVKQLEKMEVITLHRQTNTKTSPVICKIKEMFK